MAKRVALYLRVSTDEQTVENQRLEFRSEFFNLWNHPNFNNPSFVDVSGPEFGAITTMAGTPRVIQFMLRYGF